MTYPTAAKAVPVCKYLRAGPRENSTYELSPAGTAESSPGRSPGERVERRTSPVGTAENYPGCNPGVLLPPRCTIRDSGQKAQDQVLGNFQPSLRDCSLHMLTQDCVLGYSQPSLRDSVWRGWFSRHTSAVPFKNQTFSATCKSRRKLC
jgi:hypothetical protein